jgi:hypothetical protein
VERLLKLFSILPKSYALYGYVVRISLYKILINDSICTGAYEIFVTGKYLLMLMLFGCHLSRKTASNYTDTFDLLLDTYNDIGEHLSILAQYQKLFPDHSQVNRVLEQVFRDIFEFHLTALEYFQQPCK